MSILVNKNTRIVVQGLGATGQFHTRKMLAYGSKIVAGVHPGKEGTDFEGVPIYNTMERAVKEHNANTSCVFVPAFGAADAILEAADSGVDLVVAITEGIPALDMVRVKRHIDDRGVKMIGPNCPGIITVDECKIGIMPVEVHKKGPIGLISRSGTLTYEAVDQLTKAGLGQTTCLGIGGDPVPGMNFVDVLKLFKDDEETKGIVLIGEIGGQAEERAAAYIAEHIDKPVAAFIAGRTAPPGKRMGHAGAIISGGSGKASDKIKCLEEHGIMVSPTPADIGRTMKKAWEAKYGS